MKLINKFVLFAIVCFGFLSGCRCNTEPPVPAPVSAPANASVTASVAPTTAVVDAGAVTVAPGSVEVSAEPSGSASVSPTAPSSK